MDKHFIEYAIDSPPLLIHAVLNAATKKDWPRLHLALQTLVEAPEFIWQESVRLIVTSPDYPLGLPSECTFNLASAMAISLHSPTPQSSDRQAIDFVQRLVDAVKDPPLKDLVLPSFLEHASMHVDDPQTIRPLIDAALKDQPRLPISILGNAVRGGHLQAAAMLAPHQDGLVKFMKGLLGDADLSKAADKDKSWTRGWIESIPTREEFRATLEATEQRPEHAIAFIDTVSKTLDVSGEPEHGMATSLRALLLIGHLKRAKNQWDPAVVDALMGLPGSQKLASLQAPLTQWAQESNALGKDGWNMSANALHHWGAELAVYATKAHCTSVLERLPKSVLEDAHRQKPILLPLNAVSASHHQDDSEASHEAHPLPPKDAFAKTLTLLQDAGHDLGLRLGEAENTLVHALAQADTPDKHDRLAVLMDLGLDPHSDNANQQIPMELLPHHEDFNRWNAVIDAHQARQSVQSVLNALNAPAPCP